MARVPCTRVKSQRATGFSPRGAVDAEVARNQRGGWKMSEEGCEVTRVSRTSSQAMRDSRGELTGLATQQKSSLTLTVVGTGGTNGAAGPGRRQAVRACPGLARPGPPPGAAPT